VAGLFAILKTLARLSWRDLRTLRSITGNNFIVFVLVVMYQQPQSVYFFFMILGVLMIGPLSADPLRKVPPDRLALWPLSPRERTILRFATPFLTPLVWIALPLVFLAGFSVAAALIAIVVALQLGLELHSRFTAGRPPRNAFRFVPAPPGRLGGLVRKNIRQMLSVLDPYLAILLSAGGFAYRMFAHNPDPEATVILSAVVGIAMSTSAQCLFGLDLPQGMVRYRLYPLRGWEILLSKGIAYLAILFVIVAPLAPLPGLGAGLIGLAFGHHTAVLQPLPQTRWRLTGGIIAPAGLVQIVTMTAVAIAIARESPLYLALAIVAYIVSLWFYGRLWDRLSE